ncbi:MAG: tetratricopeptide repeat protein [Pseudolabrys sp.]
MRSPTCAAFPFIIVVMAFGRPAAADDRDTCKNSSGEVAIDACSSAITSKKFKGRTLSLLYTNRGVEYVVKEDIDHGIADHDQAIKLDPKNSIAFNNRGNAYGAKREFDRAIADYDQAIKLNPKYAAAFYNRGVAKQKKGDLEGSEADIAQAKQLQPGIGQQ